MASTGYSIQLTGKPMSYQQVTITTASAVGLTIPPSADRVILQLETDSDVYWRDDGTAPTNGVGMRLFAGNTLELTQENSMANFKVIATDATVKLNVAYYRRT